MTVKELMTIFATMPENAEVFADDQNKRHMIRDVHFDNIRSKNNMQNKVGLRIWLTDEELFEEEQKRADEERKTTERLLTAKKKKRH